MTSVEKSRTVPDVLKRIILWKLSNGVERWNNSASQSGGGSQLECISSRYLACISTKHTNCWKDNDKCYCHYVKVMSHQSFRMPWNIHLYYTQTGGVYIYNLLHAHASIRKKTRSEMDTTSLIIHKWWQRPVSKINLDVIIQTRRISLFGHLACL